MRSCGMLLHNAHEWNDPLRSSILLYIRLSHSSGWIVDCRSLGELVDVDILVPSLKSGIGDTRISFLCFYAIEFTFLLHVESALSRTTLA